jgi:hypothetical protein
MLPVVLEWTHHAAALALSLQASQPHTAQKRTSEERSSGDSRLRLKPVVATPIPDRAGRGSQGRDVGLTLPRLA